MNKSPTTNNNVIVNPTHVYEERHQQKTDLETVIEQLTEEINEVEKGITNTYYDTVPKQPGMLRGKFSRYLVLKLLREV